MDAETDAAKIKEDEEISEMNIKAFSDLMISMNSDTAEGKVAFNLVAGSRDEVNYPKGNAKEAWDKLKDEYEPKTITSKICVRLEEMKHPVSEEDQFIHIIGSLPLKYRQEQKDFEKMMKANTLTIKYIKEELNSAQKDFANATEGGGRGPFLGTYFHCGIRGHKKHECRRNLENRNNGNNGNKNNNSNNNDDDKDDVAEVVLLMATETFLAPEEPTKKKNVWFEWNEECEESDWEDEEADDEVIVHAIVEDPNDKVHEHGNFLHDAISLIILWRTSDKMIATRKTTKHSMRQSLQVNTLLSQKRSRTLF
ncbi:unnamed protein product [Cylindrotheca closterium]|uniref:Uncharacterized protein n=1 Tax=Cylindrotheca closterium TaxID=2856 RepID=A0AAD2CKE0_9STRA|nr:unnamed protein product [Cylindrotheca closterium]